jgi:hypothetical protein
VRALSVFPLVYAAAALVYLAAGGPASWPLGVVHGLVMIASLVLIVRSILHIRRNDRLTSEEKITWLLLVLFVGFITLPIYWFVVARSGPNGSQQATRAASG